MINNVVAIVVSIAVVTGVFGALYVWFGVLQHHFHGAAADLPIRTTSLLPDGSTGGLLGDRLRAIIAKHMR